MPSPESAAYSSAIVCGGGALPRASRGGGGRAKEGTPWACLLPHTPAAPNGHHVASNTGEQISGCTLACDCGTTLPASHTMHGMQGSHRTHQTKRADSTRVVPPSTAPWTTQQSHTHNHTQRRPTPLSAGNRLASDTSAGNHIVCTVGIMAGTVGWGNDIAVPGGCWQSNEGLVRTTNEPA